MLFFFIVLALFAFDVSRIDRAPLIPLFLQEPLHLKHQNQWQPSSMRLQILRACGFMVDQFHECLDIYRRRMESLKDNMV